MQQLTEHSASHLARPDPTPPKTASKARDGGRGTRHAAALLALKMKTTAPARSGSVSKDLLRPPGGAARAAPIFPKPRWSATASHAKSLDKMLVSWKLPTPPSRILLATPLPIPAAMSPLIVNNVFATRSVTSLFLFLLSFSFVCSHHNALLLQIHSCIHVYSPVVILLGPTFPGSYGLGTRRQQHALHEPPSRGTSHTSCFADSGCPKGPASTTPLAGV